MKSAEGVCSWRRAARERPPRDENMLVMLFCVIYREGGLTRTCADDDDIVNVGGGFCHDCVS